MMNFELAMARQEKKLDEVYYHVQKLITTKFNLVYEVFSESDSYDDYDEAVSHLDAKDGEVSAYISGISYMCKKAYAVDWTTRHNRLYRFKVGEYTRVLKKLQKLYGKCETDPDVNTNGNGMKEN